MTQQEGQDFVKTVCREKALSTQEIVVLIDKNSAYVSTRYISPLISSGDLEYTHPEMIQHPDQKYKTKLKDVGRKKTRLPRPRKISR